VTAPARRGLTEAVIACLAGAGLTILATTRAWSTVVTRRPAPLPPLHTPQTGSAQIGWLIALALVALAGAGALPATRGRIRVLIGGLLGLAGLGIVGGGIDGLRLAEGTRYAWPVLVIVGGLLVAYAGWGAIRNGATWPSMGSKYERAATGPAGHPVNRPITDASMWDDLDRGVDPTADSSS
jgi:hypothetical protein